MTAMFILKDPYTEAALAAERRGRFLAEATHARQIARLAPVHAGQTSVSRFVIALRAGAVAGTAWLGSTRPTRRQHRLSLSGES